MLLFDSLYHVTKQRYFMFLHRPQVSSHSCFMNTEIFSLLGEYEEIQNFKIRRWRNGALHPLYFEEWTAEWVSVSVDLTPLLRGLLRATADQHL